MRLYRSSDLGHLVDCLQNILEQPGPGLLEPEVILVQSAGMERWLTRELTRRRGVAANLTFPFPRAFLLGLLDRVLGEEPRALRYERKFLVWEVFGLLAELQDLPGYEAVAHNLASDEDRGKALRLAVELADLFDQYLTYRPQMMLQWAAGKEEADFQSDLFRRLVARLGPFHLAERLRILLGETDEATLRRCLPARLTLVGGTGLPPIYLRVLARIGEFIPVHVLSFQVCSEYFADLHPGGELLPELGAGAHPLLVSLGKLGADFQQLLEQSGNYTEVDAFFPRPAGTSLLSALQSDIQSGNRREPENALPPQVLADGSITLDSCHSPLREVEVLADRLLGWFREDPSLRPEDVVVLAPDIEAYSPLISAVFGARAEGTPRIPFRIADRTEGSSNPAAKALLRGLQLLTGRFKASSLLDWLQLEPVQLKYQLSPVDLERLADWLKQVGLRWGVDEAHLESFGIQSEGAHTLSWALRRLLLGYACADDGFGWWQGTVPFDDVPAGDAELLGKLCELSHQLLTLRQIALQGLRRAQDWFGFALTFFDAFVGSSATSSWDPWTVRQVIVELERCAEAAGGDCLVGLGPVVRLLERELESRTSGAEFLSGGVTFCALLPLRTIPFRRICVLGLDQTHFPRSDVASSLSWIERAPRVGDRSLRADDRFLFLEILLAAGERLALSSVGRSVQDNSECPASVVVSELTEVLAAMTHAAGPTGERRVFHPRMHPLQPFSPRYFAGTEGLVSFDGRAYRGAEALVQQESGQNRVISAFVDARLEPWDGVEQTELTIEELGAFFKNPARAYLAGLEVRIDDEIEQFEDREPTSSDALTRFGLGDDLVRRGLRGAPVFPEVHLARGELPPSSAGLVVFSAVDACARDIVRQAEALVVGHEAHSWDVDLRLRGVTLADRPIGVRLTGRFDLVGPVFLRAGYGAPDAKRQLVLWLQHLCLSASGAQVRSVLVGRARQTSGQEAVESVQFAALDPESAKRELESLVSCFLQGLEAPLCFFPEASLGFAQEYHKAGVADVGQRLEIDQRAWAVAEQRLDTNRVGVFVPREVAQVFRDGQPLAHFGSEQRARFAQTSLRIFSPLLRRVSAAFEQGEES